jgi:hypothetical protein
MSIEKSESIKSLTGALAQFHKSVTKITKDGVNPYFNNKYASLSNILDGIKQPLQESGLVFTQLPSGEDELITMLIHAESGEFISSCYSMKPIKNDPQGRGSAISYQRRYSLAAILGLNIDDDDDANAASTPPKKSAQLPQINDRQLLQFLGKLETAKDMNEVDILLKNVKANFTFAVEQSKQIASKVGVISKKFNGSSEANK